MICRIRNPDAIHNDIIESISSQGFSTTFTKNKIYYEINKTTSPLSDELSKDLIKRGMKFVGSVIIYSYLQAIGIIYSHEENCFLFK